MCVQLTVHLWSEHRQGKGMQKHLGQSISHGFFALAPMLCAFHFSLVFC